MIPKVGIETITNAELYQQLDFAWQKLLTLSEKHSKGCPNLAELRDDQWFVFCVGSFDCIKLAISPLLDPVVVISQLVPNMR